MKLYSILILYKPEGASDAKLLRASYDLSQFGYFQRDSIQQFMSFTSGIVVGRMAAGSRTSVKEQEYFCHAYLLSTGLAAVCITDADYVRRVAHGLLAKLITEFQTAVPVSVYSAPSSGPPGAENPAVAARFPQLDKYLTDYQNPANVDSMTKLQMDLDETKIILHHTLEAMLQRGEKLDDLVAKSEALSNQSKMFYTTARKTNRCCTIL